jgi:hypothetical protein
MGPTHDNYGPRDNQPLLDGDTFFSGLNMSDEPDLLEPGQYCFARNIRIRRRKPGPRRGAVRQSWGTASTPNVTGVFASCSFRAPTGASYILKARANHCEACDPVGGVQTIAYPGGVTLSSEAELVQAFDRVLLFRGKSSAALQWIPPSDWVNPFSVGFTAVTQDGTGGANPIPNAPWGYLFKNRMLVPEGRDGLAASDVLNYTRYDAIRQQFRINAGDEQSLKGVIKAGRNSLLIGKDYSFYLLENFVADLTQVTQDALPIDVGLGARRTLCSYGEQIFWMGPDGSIYSLSQALDSRLQGDEKAFSDPVEPLIASIKPNLIDACIARIWDKRLYVAVPISNAATAPNALLVYDFVRGSWVGIDTSEYFEFQNLLIFPYQGKQRLFFVHTDGSIYLLEEGQNDIGPDGTKQIETDFISRGYTCRYEAAKKFKRAEVVVATSNPSYSIYSAANGGVLE